VRKDGKNPDIGGGGIGADPLGGRGSRELVGQLQTWGTIRNTVQAEKQPVVTPEDNRREDRTGKIAS